jgi:6-phospho-3-hexuloisomerase
MPTCYSTQEMMRMMATKISAVADMIPNDEAQAFLVEILNATRIYVAGAGRSGLFARAFAMRLMHLGLEAYVVGETITPAMRKGDTLVVFSGSGRTLSIVDISETAKSLGGRLCLITTDRTSPIGEMADCVVELKTHQDESIDVSPKFEVRQLTGEYRSLSQPFAPLGTIFETAAIVFTDAIIVAIIETKHCSIEELRDRLANIQ